MACLNLFGVGSIAALSDGTQLAQNAMALSNTAKSYNQKGSSISVQ